MAQTQPDMTPTLDLRSAAQKTAPTDVVLSNGKILPARYAAYKDAYESIIKGLQPESNLGTGLPSMASLATDTTSSSPTVLANQKTDLANRLNVQKDADLKALDDTLASRGISRSGAVQAGTADIAGKYAQALASGNVSLDAADQTYQLNKQNADIYKKYQEALINNMTNKTGGGGIYMGEIKNEEPMGLSDVTKGYGTTKELSDYAQFGTIPNTNVVNTTSKKTPAVKASAYSIY